jgi:hypothetical protein
MVVKLLSQVVELLVDFVAWMDSLSLSGKRRLSPAYVINERDRDAGIGTPLSLRGGVSACRDVCFSGVRFGGSWDRGVTRDF